MLVLKLATLVDLMLDILEFGGFLHLSWLPATRGRPDPAARHRFRVRLRRGGIH